MEINFKILGSTALRIGDHFDRQWAQTKPRGMLAALLLRPYQSVTADELIALMWPHDKIPREPVATLAKYVKRLREALDRMDTPPLIRVGGGVYRIEVDREEIDFFAFRRLVERADSARRQGDQTAANRMLTAAVDLWTDRAFADLQGERADDRRMSAEKDHLLPAHSALLLGLCALGEFDDVLRRLSDLPHGYQETLMLVKCRLEALRGLHRSQEAIGYYLDQRKRLVENFDQDSAAELTRFHDELTRRSRDHRPVVTIPGGAPEVPHLLPHHVRDFIGREALLDQLDMITPATVTVLVGEPGVGKTALTLHWAHHVVEQRFPDGVLYVDLNGFGEGARVDPAEVAEKFLGALGYPAERIPNMAGKLSRLRRLLAGRRTLVVLDNAGDAAHIRLLLDCFSTCAVLVTSRRRLAGLGQTTVPVPPMTYHESKALLTQRLGARAAAEPGALGQLVGLCGGIAMMLRVVAEHVHSRPRVPLIEFVEELRDGQTLLGLGDDGYGLDGSVRAAFERSYRALEQDERRLFRLLGLNPGSDISLDAAAALLGWERRQAKRALDTLVDAYLLGQPESRDRYRFHDLLRKYARECSDEHPEEFGPAGERLLSFYLYSTSNADMLAFPGRDEVPMLQVVHGVLPLSFANADSAIQWIVRERANLNAIVRFAATRGFPDYATRLPSSIGEIYLRLGYYSDVSLALNMAVQSARSSNDAEREAVSLGNLGFVSLTLHDLVSAEQYLFSAQEKLDEVGDMVGSAVNRGRIGRLQVEKGALKEGIQTQLDALVLLQRTGVKGSIVIALYRLAEAYRRAHNFDAAISFCADSLAGAREIGDRRSEVLCLIELALTHYGRGDLTAAESTCERGLAVSSEIRETSQLGRYYHLVALICHDRGQFEEAERLSRIALDRCRAARDVKTEGSAWETLADATYKLANTEHAVDAWRKALAIYDDLSDPRAEAVRLRLADSAVFPSLFPTERTAPLLGARLHSHLNVPPTV